MFGYVPLMLNPCKLIHRFFESRNDPVNDPVVLWLNGGEFWVGALGNLFRDLFHCSPLCSSNAHIRSWLLLLHGPAHGARPMQSSASWR